MQCCIFPNGWKDKIDDVKTAAGSLSRRKAYFCSICSFSSFYPCILHRVSHRHILIPVSFSIKPFEYPGKDFSNVGKVEDVDWDAKTSVNDNSDFAPFRSRNDVSISNHGNDTDPREIHGVKNECICL